MEASTERKLDAPTVLSYLRDAAPGPMSLEALIAALELDEADQPRLKELVDTLAADGSVVETRGRYGCPERMNLIVGVVRAHADGFAFIAATGGSGQPDLFVAGKHINGAMHGDRVIGRIEHRRRSGRIEGRVIRILERARTKLVGTYRPRGKFPMVRPLDPRLGGQVLIADSEVEATDGQLVVVEITEPGTGSSAPAGKLIEVLGEPTDTRVDVEVVIREFNLRHEFPADVLAEAEQVPSEVVEADIEGRTDFRQTPIITIDGETAQDFDDAVHVELRPNGLYRLHVHIADVGHYVQPGSAIDREAIERGSSVYFVDRVLPMLPESLSNNICSLKPGVDRLVQSILIDIDRDGRTVNYEFHDGVIHSAARMTYREVAAVLEGDEAAIAKHKDRVRDLERMAEMAEILRGQRRERGSIDFDLPEPLVVLNLRGETEDVIRSERNVAHRLIEEFMVRANEVVASHLVWEDVPALFRVHEGPDPERVASLREFLSGLGHTLEGGSDPRPRDFMELLGRLQGRPEERVVSMMLLRCMKRAQYRTQNDGHFGLASARYTHFTSPIRRYPDLVAHRALRAERASEQEGAEPVSLDVDLAALAASVSTLERRAEEAERNYASWKKLQFMGDKIGETYEGHIVAVKSFGCFVELDPFFVEGMISVSSLDDDYYRFDEARHQLRGENTGRVLKLGDRVRITVAKVDLERRHLDFGLTEGPLEQEPPPPARRRRRRRSRGGRGARTRKEAGEARATEETKTDKAPAVSGDKPAEEGQRPRRRRGRRGGRRRTQARTQGGESSEAKPERGERQGGEGQRSDRKRSDRQGADRQGSSRQSSDRQSSERGSDRKVEAGQGGADRQRKSSDSSRGSDRSGRGRGRRDQRGQRNQRGKSRPRQEGARPAAAAVKPKPETPAESGKDKARPAVNPYLTDIDF